MGRLTSKTLVERFEEKFTPVTESGCWLWTASCHDRGYGLFYTGRNLKKGKMEFAHRVSYELYKGTRPAANEEVCHRCDTPCCVNPDHLFLGSHRDNMVDMVEKNRFVAAGQKVNEDEMLIAINMRECGYSMKDIATALNISSSHASRISRGIRKYFNKEDT